jgi:general secretion pathway protein G
MRNVKRRAFTLIELLLVLVILGVLAAIVVPKLSGKSEDAKIKATKAEIAIIENALDQFEIHCSRYPTSEEGLRALVERPGNVEGWQGPYVKKGVPTDQWNREYVYTYPPRNNTDGPDLYSFGPDGREGTDDIVNWTTN